MVEKKQARASSSGQQHMRPNRRNFHDLLLVGLAANERRANLHSKKFKTYLMYSDVRRVCNSLTCENDDG